MYNCIFNSHCIQDVCDNSCPILVETSYLLERNNINLDNPVFLSFPDNEQILIDTVCDETNSFKVITCKDTLLVSDFLTYYAICHNWKGNRLHCNVYHLRYSSYLEKLKGSWNSTSEDEDLQYMKIWSDTCKVLIISNIDYVKFNDFESQTLLNLIQSRSITGKLTVVVSPPLSNLVSGNSSRFFDLLKDKMKSSMKAVSLK